MRTLLLIVIAGLLAAACGASDGGLRDEGFVAAGETAVVSPPDMTGDAAATTTPATLVPDPGVAFVYLLRYDQPEPTRRSVPVGMGIVESSIRDLLVGPSAAEGLLHYSTALLPDTRLLAFSIDNRTAIIDLSAMPSVGKGSEALLALYQLVYTATASGGVDAVKVRVNGRAYGLGSVSGGSSALEQSLTRADLSFVIEVETLLGSSGCAVAKVGAAPFTGARTVTLRRPLDGELVENTIQLRGSVQSRGGPLVIRILQDGLEVTNRIIDEKCRGNFSASIPVPRTLDGAVDVVVIAPGTDGAPAASAQVVVTIAG